jgi:Spy/CpxP family protein refolding chaperone
MIRGVFIAAVLTVLLASLAYAQGGGGGQMGRGGGFGRGQQVDKLELLAGEFKLNPEQKTAIASIMDAAQSQADPLVPRIASQEKGLLELAVEGKDTNDLTKQLAALNAQMANIEADAFAKALGKLDAKQELKAPKLFELMDGMFTEPGGWRKSK